MNNRYTSDNRANTCIAYYVLLYNYSPLNLVRDIGHNNVICRQSLPWVASLSHMKHIQSYSIYVIYVGIHSGIEPLNLDLGLKFISLCIMQYNYASSVEEEQFLILAYIVAFK